MTVTIPRFRAALLRMGSDVIFHREEGGTACPCRTPEGFRDPAWHRLHPPGRPAGFVDGMNWAYNGAGKVAAVYYGIEAGNKNMGAAYGNVINYIDDGTGMGIVDGVVGPVGPFDANLFANGVQHTHTFTMGVLEGHQEVFAAGFLVINPPICNEQGFLAVVNEFAVKASIQPAIHFQARPNERTDALLGDIQRDDKLGIFPCEWNGHVVDFSDWSEAGEDYVLYDGNRYIAVATDKVPDVDGDPSHHWEVGLRLVRDRA